ncbi:helix-turn-helix domain-containing protein [Dactylosporangium sp. NPDC048998]|uniref:AraC family transcriptional regulator n=1 Tax=Dactylosporangium sp. NPDC048998 TaxID=3363976 RepID=UPI00370FBA4D
MCASDRLGAGLHAECSIVAGGFGAIAGLLLGRPSREPRLLLVHRLDERDPGDPAAGQPRSLLVTHPRAVPPESRGGRTLALAAPLTRVTNAALAPATHLNQTPLVRASRSMMAGLLSDLDHGGRRFGLGVDDVLLSLLRGIVLEHPDASRTAPPEATMAARLRAFIEARHTDSRLDVAQVARELGISRRQLHRHAPAGGVAAMLAERRLATARDLLAAHGALTVAEVAERSGFGTASRLRAQLARRSGGTPKALRRAASG